MPSYIKIPISGYFKGKTFFRSAILGCDCKYNNRRSFIFPICGKTERTVLFLGTAVKIGALKLSARPAPQLNIVFGTSDLHESLYLLYRVTGCPKIT